MLLLLISQPSENSHWPLAPHAIFFVLQRIYVKQTPPSTEQPVDFFSPPGFQIVSGNFNDIQLP